MGFRVGRTSEDLKRELTDIIRHVKDPRVSSILTIIKVELSNDLSHCKVYISSLEGMDKAKEAVKGLNNANGFIKHEVIPASKCAAFQISILLRMILPNTAQISRVSSTALISKRTRKKSKNRSEKGRDIVSQMICLEQAAKFLSDAQDILI